MLDAFVTLVDDLPSVKASAGTHPERPLAAFNVGFGIFAGLAAVGAIPGISSSPPRTTARRHPTMARVSRSRMAVLRPERWRSSSASSPLPSSRWWRVLGSNVAFGPIELVVPNHHCEHRHLRFDVVRLLLHALLGVLRAQMSSASMIRFMVACPIASPIHRHSCSCSSRAPRRSTPHSTTMVITRIAATSSRACSTRPTSSGAGRP